jgi:hypothetical protein
MQTPLQLGPSLDGIHTVHTPRNSAARNDDSGFFTPLDGINTTTREKITASGHMQVDDAQTNAAAGAP